jgi:NADPH2:quinone reductase
VADGSVKVLVHARLPLEKVGEAHRMMEAGDNIGKIVLTA